MEVEKDDFIWIGPYCPQKFFYATWSDAEVVTSTTRT